MPMTMRSLLTLIVCCLLLNSAEASRDVPDFYIPYAPEHLKLNPGYALYTSGGYGLMLVPPEPEAFIVVGPSAISKVSKAFAEITTPEQATELCTTFMHGGIIADRQAYDKILSIHTEAGFKQEVKDEELVFDRVAEKTDKGFKVAFTAFYLPDGMGAQSEVTRLEFNVGHDATVTFSNTVYLEGMALNWQTMELDTEEKRQREADAQARLKAFLAGCLKHCSTKLHKRQHENK